MTLRKRFFLTATGAVLVISLGLHYAASHLLERQLRSMESVAKSDVMQRLSSVLLMDVAAFHAGTEDWAAWTDSWDFIQSPSESFAGYANIKDLMISRRLVYAGYFDRAHNPVMVWTVSGDSVLAAADSVDVAWLRSQLVGMRHASQEASGVLCRDSLPLMVSLRPVQTTAKDVPSNGTFVTVRFLDSVQRALLADYAGGQAFSLVPATGTATDIEVVESKSNGDTLVIRRALRDPFGVPTVALEVPLSRSVWTEQYEAITLLSWFPLGVGLVLVLVIMALLDSVVFRRLRLLAHRLANPEEALFHSPSSGSDELAAIENSASDMVKRVEEYSRSQEGLLREHQELLSVIAHDIKNPLSSIILTAGLLRARWQVIPEEQAKEMLSGTERSARYLSDLVRTLLDVQRIEAGEWHLRLCRVDVVPVWERVYARMEPKASKRNIEIRVAVAPHAVQADEHALERCIENLISNAVKYSFQGSVVEIVGEEYQGRYLFSVRDRGPGIAKVDLDRLFKKYVRLGHKPANGESSTGLGLYIVKTLVTAMNGTVEVESAPGEGTAFTLGLPCEQFAAADNVYHHAEANAR